MTLFFVGLGAFIVGYLMGEARQFIRFYRMMEKRRWKL